MLFRALPIAAGVLIGQRYNMRFTGLVIAMIIQALIFGAGHANYPAQPSYARVIELFLPSIIVYGMIYLKLGEKILKVMNCGFTIGGAKKFIILLKLLIFFLA